MQNKIIDNVKETIKYGGYRKIQLMDGALGLCGETSEAMVEYCNGNVAELESELGDALWYLYSISEGLNIIEAIPPITDIETATTETNNLEEYGKSDVIFYCLTKSCEIADIIKKFTMKGVDIDVKDIVDRLRYLMIMFCVVAHRSDIEMRSVVESLLNKLNERYPDGPAGGEVR